MESCEHGVPFAYDCRYCRLGIEPYNCPHGVDSQLGCPKCKPLDLKDAEQTKTYTSEQVRKLLILQRHNCQIERNKRSKLIDGVWYVACEDILREPLVN